MSLRVCAHGSQGRLSAMSFGENLGCQNAHAASMVDLVDFRCLKNARLCNTFWELSTHLGITTSSCF